MFPALRVWRDRRGGLMSRGYVRWEAKWRDGKEAELGCTDTRFPAWISNPGATTCRLHSSHRAARYLFVVGRVATSPWICQ